MSKRHFLIPDNEASEWTGSAYEHLTNSEMANAAAGCPHVKEARETLNLTERQFCRLLGISYQEYWAFVGSGKEPTIAQKILIVRALGIALQKGYI